jgi:hypothetical protein
VLASSAFLSLLRPLVKSLTLESDDADTIIGPDQFAAICELSNLEELSISSTHWVDDVSPEPLSDHNAACDEKVL